MRKARTSEGIRQHACNLLLAADAFKTPVPLDQVTNHLGIDVRYAPYEGELAGMIMKVGNSAVIGVNSLHRRTRQRFTVAHELGHYVLHNLDIHVDTTFPVKRRDEVSSLAIDVEEIEANRFAAELLMPKDLLVPDILSREIDFENDEDIAALADRYQVSRQAMTLRITNVIRYGARDAI